MSEEMNLRCSDENAFKFRTLGVTRMWQLTDHVMVHGHCRMQIRWICEVTMYMTDSSQSEGLFRDYFVIKNRLIIHSNGQH